MHAPRILKNNESGSCCCTALCLTSAERKPAWAIRTARFNILKTQVLAERELILASHAPAASASAPEELHHAASASNTADVVSALSHSFCATVPVPKPDAPIPSAAVSESEPKDKSKPPPVASSISQQPPP